ncbi:SGNH/GDSL hydrolase family protein [Bacillus sp. FJAT-29814]|uniref:SGNH/GDSL hydrolase family protein n=1 Tax=Bacillus sp. FJAT-29814 TaxID=1729688 RepID=UPI0008372DBA|nr:SGNH/GDSL hydrolase family protein [Bacillus sp. FJAT-29814]
MQKVLTLLLCIAFIAVLYVGQSHWNDKITGTSAKNKQTGTLSQGEAAEEEQAPMDEKLLALTKNWPAEAAENFKKKLVAGDSFKILFVGSPAIGTESEGVFPLVKQGLLAAYGADHLEVGLKTYNSTSNYLIKENKTAEIAAEQADLVVIEPFMLKNNGLVSPANTFNDLSKIIEDVRSAKPETVFIIQPSYPIYKADIYPKQTSQLKTFAEEQKLTYLDHWTAWPDANTEGFKDYITADKKAVTDKGAQVWSLYLIEYFVQKSES